MTENTAAATTVRMPAADKACKKHPAFEASNCPECGTAAKIPGTAAPAKKAPAKKTTPAKATPAKKAAAPAKTAEVKKERPATPFVLDTKRSRKTGTAVSALALTHPEAFISAPASHRDHKFGALCLDHCEMFTGLNRREVQKIAADPSQWCSKCGGPNGKTVSVPRAKAALAVKPNFGVRKGSN